jgi:hypothetical protein
VINQIFSPQTLKMDGVSSLPIWRSGLALLVIIAASFVAAEIVGRTPLGSHLPPPSVGADSFEFDIKVYYLEQSIRQRGALDCLILGDSMANDGPDPRLVEEAYQSQTGTPIHCFNFGIPSLTLDSSGPLAEAVTRRFHPKLLIFILASRDFVPKYGGAYRHVVKSAWTKYNLGETSPRGWAVNTLYAYRYYLLLKYVWNPSNRSDFVVSWHNISTQGFTPLHGIAPPRKFFRAKQAFDLYQPDAQKGLERLLQLKSDGTNILILDAPLKPDYYAAFAEKNEGEYIAPMSAVFEQHDIPFWLTKDLAGTIPDDAWYDNLHVNEQGTLIISNWLGKRLAEHYPPDFFK